MANSLESVVQGVQYQHVDREKTCPLLLRVFCTYGRHQTSFNYSKGQFPLTEFQIYTWMDATLREITNLIREVNEEANEKGTSFDFQLVMPDKGSPRYISRDIGTTTCGTKGIDDEKTLSHCKFVIGDYMDVCITPPPRNQLSGFRRTGIQRYKN